MGLYLGDVSGKGLPAALHRPVSPAELLGWIFATVENFSRGREQHNDMAAAVFQFCG